MGKQPKPELSAGLIASKGSAAPSTDMPTRAAPVAPSNSNNTPREQTESTESLNFKVATSFHREFKAYAASHGLKLNELLRLSFEAYRKQQGS